MQIQALCYNPLLPRQGQFMSLPGGPQFFPDMFMCENFPQKGCHNTQPRTFPHGSLGFSLHSPGGLPCPQGLLGRAAREHSFVQTFPHVTSPEVSHMKVQRECGPLLTSGRSPSHWGVRAYPRPWSLVSGTVTMLVGCWGQRGKVPHPLQPWICTYKVGLTAAPSPWDSW